MQRFFLAHNEPLTGDYTHKHDWPAWRTLYLIFTLTHLLFSGGILFVCLFEIPNLEKKPDKIVLVFFLLYTRKNCLL